MGKPAKKITPFTETVVTRYDTLAEAFPRDWDEMPGNMQGIKRVREREELGQKMTPIGRGTLRRVGSG